MGVTHYNPESMKYQTVHLRSSANVLYYLHCGRAELPAPLADNAREIIQNIYRTQHIQGNSSGVFQCPPLSSQDELHEASLTLFTKTQWAVAMNNSVFDSDLSIPNTIYQFLTDKKKQVLAHQGFLAKGADYDILTGLLQPLLRLIAEYFTPPHPHQSLATLDITRPGNKAFVELDTREAEAPKRCCTVL
jgi:lysine/ornithine N-monooxygenase